MNFQRMILASVFMIVFLIPLYYAYNYFAYVADNSAVKNPNVLLITMDTCQYGAVGAYGNPEVYTPFMNRLARQGVTFARGYAPVPTTGPSHATMFTGRSPCTHRVFRNAMTYSGEYVTLAKLLKDSGYQTAAFVSGYSLTARTCGLDLGFDYYDDSWSEKVLERSAEDAVDSCIDWLKTNGEKRYFVWLHIFDPHTPYQNQEPFYSLIKSDDTDTGDAVKGYTTQQIENYQKNVDKALAQNDFMVLTKHPMSTTASSETCRKKWESYLSEVSYADSHLERLGRVLRQMNSWKNTLMVLTADHGEGFDHDYFFAHGDRLWESAIRVPWIVKPPKSKQKNQISRSIARHADIFPTVKEFCNISLPVFGIEGISLKNSMEYGLIGGAPSWMVIAPPLPRKNISKGTVIAVYEPQFKMIRTVDTNEDQLFLVTQDPGETTDVSARYPRIAERLSKRLEKARRFCNIPKVEDLTTNEVDQSEQLKALGYIQ